MQRDPNAHVSPPATCAFGVPTNNTAAPSSSRPLRSASRGRGNLMEQCSSSARHPTSRLPPRLAGGGTVLTKGLTCAQSSVWCSPAGWPHSKPPSSQAHCIAFSSFLLAAGAVAGDGPGGDRRLRGLQLDPGSGRVVPVTRVGRSARRAASPPGEGRCRPPQRVTGRAPSAPATPVPARQPPASFRVGHHAQVSILASEPYKGHVLGMVSDPAWGGVARHYPVGHERPTPMAGQTS
jgi:hypothetical protein